MNRLELLAILVFCAAVITGGITWTLLQYNECREAGFSMFYCIQHVL